VQLYDTSQRSRARLLGATVVRWYQRDTEGTIVISEYVQGKR